MEIRLNSTARNRSSVPPTLLWAGSREGKLPLRPSRPTTPGANEDEPSPFPPVSARSDPKPSVARLTRSIIPGACRADSARTTFSTTVFHSPHSEHLPTHFGVTRPQPLHSNLDLEDFFAMPIANPVAVPFRMEGLG